MRFVQLALFPPEGCLHPVGRILSSTSTVDRTAILYVDAFPDATGVVLYQLEGTPETLESRVDEHPSVLRCDVFPGQDPDSDEWYCYAHVEGAEPATGLMALVHRHALLVETPIDVCADGSLRVTVAGTQRAIHRSFQRLDDVVDFEVRTTGEYDPVDEGIVAQLTKKQRCVLRAAIDLGYYEVPRQATHVDIADELGCASSTVDEHLRKAESTVFAALLR